MGQTLEDLYDSNTSKEDRTKALKESLESFEATIFLMGLNDTYFGGLKKNMSHGVNVGRDEYPRTIQGAY